MELTPAQLQALQTLTVSSAKARPENLPVGQQILAKVIAMNNASGEATLSLNNTLLNVKTQLSLQINQTLQLTVAQKGNQLLLKLPEKAIEAAAIQQSLREILPQQKPVKQAINQIQQFLQQAKNLKAAEPVVQVARKLLNQLPSAKQLSQAQGLKTAIKQSGLFLENNLLAKTDNTSSTISHDLKSMLLNLKSVISRQKSPSLEKPATTDIKNLTPGANKEATSNKTELSQSKQVLDLSKTTVKADTVKPLTQQTTNIPRQQSNPLNPNPQTTSTQKTISDATVTKSPKPASPTNQNMTSAQQIKTANPKHVSQTKSGEAAEKLANTIKNIPGKTTKMTPGMVRHVLNSSLPQLNPLASQSTTKTIQATSQAATAYNDKSGFNVKDALAFVSGKEQSSQSTPPNRLTGLIDMLDNLVKSVDSAISRVQLHQLHALQDNETGKLAWSLEIPVRDEDETHLVHMEFEQEQASDKDSENIVTVNLAIDLQTLGPVYARITLMSDNVGVVLWAERDETFQLAQANINDLQDNLHKSGFKSENIACHQGCPPQGQLSETRNRHNLLDIKA